MPWFLWPMKDVHGHDSRRGAATKRLIRRSPNGATYPMEVGYCLALRDGGNALN